MLEVHQRMKETKFPAFVAFTAYRRQEGDKCVRVISAKEYNREREREFLKKARKRNREFERWGL